MWVKTCVLQSVYCVISLCWRWRPWISPSAWSSRSRTAAKDPSSPCCESARHLLEWLLTHVERTFIFDKEGDGILLFAQDRVQKRLSQAKHKVWAASRRSETNHVWNTFPGAAGWFPPWLHRLCKKQKDGATQRCSCHSSAQPQVDLNE